mgnify:CR=1 FL=1
MSGGCRVDSMCLFLFQKVPFVKILPAFLHYWTVQTGNIDRRNLFSAKVSVWYTFCDVVGINR